MSKYLQKALRWVTKLFVRGAEEAIAKEAADEAARQAGRK